MSSRNLTQENFKYIPLFYNQIDYIITSDIIEVITTYLNLPENERDWEFINAAVIVLQHYLKKEDIVPIIEKIEQVKNETSTL